MYQLVGRGKLGLFPSNVGYEPPSDHVPFIKQQSFEKSYVLVIHKQLFKTSTCYNVIIYTIILSVLSLLCSYTFIYLKTLNTRDHLEEPVRNPIYVG